LANRAVHNPVKPPPITNKSHVMSAARAGKGCGRAGLSSQNEVLVTLFSAG
jgi:hypothetical protein